MEDNKIVKSVEAKTGGKSGTYWKVTWQDDKSDNIFDKSWLPLLTQSQEGNRLLHFTKEKKGDFWNIKSLELAALPERETVTPPAPVVKQPAPVEKLIPAPVDTRVRSMAISYAKDLVAAGKIELKDMSAYANRFIDYILDVKQEAVTGGKSRLVEQAKAMGATEIEKEIKV